MIDEVIERVDGEAGDARATLRRLTALAAREGLRMIDFAVRDGSRRLDGSQQFFDAATTGAAPAGWSRRRTRSGRRGPSRILRSSRTIQSEARHCAEPI